ncbi:hypothetical protein QTP70_012429 [Hemibagrus guttatus]|uniref:Cell cycle exit and neuronal differentiation protein 1 n=1 Tax=Hemibagrus guttatus TaxID=175788 RepID=A0AAE0V0C5_9TELE|nr:hypothetical protein QTP70_012429 [Hemibagrus guttatus]
MYIEEGRERVPPLVSSCCKENTSETTPHSLIGRASFNLFVFRNPIPVLANTISSQEASHTDLDLIIMSAWITEICFPAGQPKHLGDKIPPHTSTVRMESKAKSSVKPVTKTEKKEAAPPPKPNPAPAEPAEVEKPAQDGNQEGAQEENEAAGGSCETLEHLKPFLIGGAVVALGAVLVGLVLLARKK